MGLVRVPLWERPSSRVAGLAPHLTGHPSSKGRSDDRDRHPAARGLAFGLGASPFAIGGFAALHNRWVLGALLGITVLWLLPPHRWAKRVMASGSQEQPAQAGRTEDGGGGASTVQLDVPGPGAVHRPGEEHSGEEPLFADSTPRMQ